MSWAPRSRLSTSESGLVSAGAAIGIGLALLLGYLLLAAAQPESDSYGAVAAPGAAYVELPKGQVNVHYAAPAEEGAAEALAIPADLTYFVTDPNGDGVRVDLRNDDVESDDQGSSRLIGSIDLPEDGLYTVSVLSSAALAQSGAAQLTFGQGTLGAFADRFDSVVDTLSGPAGVLAALALLALMLLPRLQRARRVRRGAGA